MFRDDAAAGFSPQTISGLALWLDASDASSITLDGSSNVSQWNDKSGNGRHVTQSTALNRPGFTAGDGLQYTSAGHTLTNATSLNWTGGDSLFVAFRCTGTAGYAVTSGNDLFFQIGGWGLSTTALGTWGRYAPLRTGSVPQPVSSISQIQTTDRVFRAVFTGITSADCKVIGATTQTGTISSMPAGGASTIAVGSFPRANMVLRECIAFDRTLTASEITQIETYLTGRWS